MNFDINALNAFRNANLAGENAIANLGENNKVEQNGTYKGPLGRIFRSDAAKANNNAVRTELLRSLGQAFGLSGMSESGGKITFSSEFVDKLSRLLGPAFKRADFGIDADGAVSSGKPLTQRRITAILKQAKIVGETGYDPDVFRTKLDHAKEVAATLPGCDEFKSRLETAEKIMVFLENGDDAIVADNPDYDPEYATIDDNPRFSNPYIVRYRDENGNQKTELYDAKLPFNQVGGKFNKMLGEHIHIVENILGIANKNATVADITRPKEQFNGYVKRTLTNYLETLLGTFAAAEKAGKVKEFAKSIDHKICIEAKTDAILNYRLDNLPLEDEPVAAAPGNAPVAAPVAAPIATHRKTQPLNQCMGREITALMTADPSIERWDQVADRVKKNLVGMIRPIDVPVKTGEIEDDDGEKIPVYKFEPLLDNEGKPVVREITAEDVDRLGEAVMSTIFNA